MSRPTIVIIEDEFFAANHLQDVVNDLGFRVLGVYHSGEDFLEHTDWAFDMAIVDIFLSGSVSGLQVAGEMSNRNKPFLFLTANQDARTLREAARLMPMAYLSKPFKPNDVEAALQIIRHRLPAKLRIRSVNGMEELSPADIWFIKSDGVYVEIYTFKGTIVQRKLLKEIADELPSNFVRVHRSYLVNEDYIEQRHAHAILVRGHEIPVSRGFRDSLN